MDLSELTSQDRVIIARSLEAKMREYEADRVLCVRLGCTVQADYWVSEIDKTMRLATKIGLAHVVQCPMERPA